MNRNFVKPCVLISACLILLASCTARQTDAVSSIEQNSPVLNGPYEVSRVVDGDTIVVEIDGTDTKVRLIGMDTPESVNPKEEKNTEEGVEASDYTKQLLDGLNVYLEYDIDPEDRYGRTLAYVYLDDGETMVNRLLVQEGYAMIMTVQPDSKYADLFLEDQTAAREAGSGFWSTGFFTES